MLVTWAENVLRLASMDCSSPMSAKTERKTGRRDPSAAGMRRPACAISASRPAVFSATVFPPVFGPVIEQHRRRRQDLDRDRHRLLEQRVPRGLQLECSVGRQPRLDAVDRLRKPGARLARRRARWPPRSCAADRAAAAERSVSASRMRRTSSASCSSSATMSLLISTVLSGSRNRLAPLVDAPCTMPGMLLRCSDLTTST